jgi:hypothetical protein
MFGYSPDASWMLGKDQLTDQLRRSLKLQVSLTEHQLGLAHVAAHFTHMRV